MVLLLNHSSQLASSLYFAVTSYSKNVSRMLVGKYDFYLGQTFLLHLLQFLEILEPNC